MDPTGRGPLRFKAEAAVGEAPGTTFPPVDPSQPTFERKKDAKKYAARCAVLWLRANGFMPQNGGAKFPKATTSFAQQMQMQMQMQQQAQPNSRQPPVFGSSPMAGQQQQQQQPPQSHPNPSLPSANLTPSSPFDADQPSARSRVAELCKALGHQAPTYRTEHVGDGFYSGWADFGDYGALLAFDVDVNAGTGAIGRVSEVLGERTAKELVAEKLLRHLRAERRRREVADEAFLAREEPNRSGGGGGGGGGVGGTV